MIGTASINNTCTIWDLNKLEVKYQIMAHTKEVFDFSFAKDVNVFVTAGADGTVRRFDQRELQSARIIYENATKLPFVRVSCCREETELIAVLAINSHETTILDMRNFAIPLRVLRGHIDYINAVSWAPGIRYSPCLIPRDCIMTAGDDFKVNIWDLELPKNREESEYYNPSEPVMTYHAENEVTTVQWPITNPEWIALTFGNKVQVLKI
eukprot:TRINITY_DN6382_c0_g3_i1.p2 TRINITY_DN6382_c0_g3~~TRINITY_DN6382_c0_g3_i1.p2  ORF type:complete len:210 (+),score=54.59 TRINITY_DN6382_c0_g3_i1:658-1287(+)